MPQARLNTQGFPEVVDFKGLWPGGTCYYDYVGFRFPKQGEHYLSGAIIEAWRAPNDLSISYHVVRPTYHAKVVARYERGAKVERPTAHV